jgi:phenylacetate-CoA ligase
MMGKWTEKVYKASPRWLQTLGINTFGYFWAQRRLGGVFEQTWREFVERETWAPERMREYVENQLRAQVQRAYRNVHYYREAFRKHGVSESLIESFTSADLSSLPLLDKSSVRRNPTSLLTEQSAKHPPKVFSTSGTTGLPIHVFWDRATHQRNVAAREARSLRWAGTSYRESRGVVGGRLIVPTVDGGPPFWRYNYWEKQLYLSAFHIGPSTVQDYVAALNRYQPSFLTGYASANYFLAKAIQESGLQIYRPQVIVTNSDRLEPYMRPTLEAVYQTKVREEYGSVENCALATECEQGGLHIHPDFGYVEILGPDGRSKERGEVGEMVVTGFTNTNQLFIRYRIGDLAAWSTEPCPCGRATLPTLKEIVGRVEDTVVLRDGRRLMRLDHAFRDLEGISEGQIVQQDYDYFLVKVVSTPAFSRTDIDSIKTRLSTRLGPQIVVEVQTVDSIPREPNGKFRMVISHISKNDK